jgi:hypothetical protein
MQVEAALERDAMEAAGGVPADDSAHVRAPALAAAKSVDDAPAPHDALPRKKKVQYHPVRNMLKNHWHSVLLQFIWEFWFAGERQRPHREDGGRVGASINHSGQQHAVGARTSSSHHLFLPLPPSACPWTRTRQCDGIGQPVCGVVATMAWLLPL